MKETQKLDMAGLEERKLREIEHSKRRRELLQGFERHLDVNRTTDMDDVEGMIRDKDAFEYHFSNTKFYSVVHSSEKYQYD